VQPKTRYAKSGDLHIAYQVIGEGPFDLVWIPGFVSNVDYYWEMPVLPRLLERLASFSRLILFDKRGTGRSDPVATVPTLEQRMDDVRSVMDAVGSERAALLGVSEGGPTSLLFAATYPERTRALVLYGTSPRLTEAPDWPSGWTQKEMRGWFEEIERGWGEGALLDRFAPSALTDPEMRKMWGDYQRAGASPAMGRALLQSFAEIDARHVLPAIRVPTLLLHRTGDALIPVEGSRYMAAQIPGARLVEFPGNDHIPIVGDPDPIWDEIEEFLTGTPPERETDRVLATVLFTDVVGSTERAAELGDRRWGDLLGRYYAAARRELGRFRGQEIDTAGDGLFASFDGPARAIRCASSIRGSVRPLGLEIRAGLHTGECERIGEKVGGIAVHIGARVAANAAPGEIVVSSTVKDLVVGSGICFRDRGPHVLKGVPGEWRLFAVEP
jgi:pimeloyl-ACP methyl ester carboxylesterase